MKERKRSSFKGVAWDAKRGKWYARIAFSGVRYALGRFETYEQALAAYQEAYAMGGMKLKAWYNKSPEYRGKLGESITYKSEFNEEEDKLKLFSSFVDGKEAEEDEYRW